MAPFSTNNRDRRSLQFESLSARQLMAGDVGVAMEGGVLTLDGDDLANAVQISRLSNGDLEIRGLSGSDGLTSVNGQYGPVTVPGDIKGLVANLGDGDDQLYVNPTGETGEQLVIDGEMRIQTQGGDDDVQIRNTRVTGDASITTDRTGRRFLAGSDYSGGDDNIDVTRFIVSGDLDVDTRGGNDTVNFGPAHASSGTHLFNITKGETRLETGDGDDTLTADLFFGSDQVFIYTGGGDDSVDMQRTYAYGGPLTIVTGNGDDSVSLSDISFYWNNQSPMYAGNPDSDLYVATGRGNDVVVLDDVDVLTGELMVVTEDGQDDVRMRDVHVRDHLFADLGDDDDRLEIGSSSAGEATLDGGDSSRQGDSLTLSRGNSFDSLVRAGWEKR